MQDCISRIKNALNEIYFLAQGGTAVGTGINSKKGFDKKIINEIKKITKLPFKPTKNKFAAFVIGGVLATCCLSTINAEPIKFDFKDPKKVNNALFLLDAPLESISGTATGISGSVTFDPKKPAATKGQIILDASTLHVDNPVMKDHMLGKGWMDVATHPKIMFIAEKFTDIKVDDTKTWARVTGKFTFI